MSDEIRRSSLCHELNDIARSSEASAMEELRPMVEKNLFAYLRSLAEGGRYCVRLSYEDVIFRTIRKHATGSPSMHTRLDDVDRFIERGRYTKDVYVCSIVSVLVSSGLSIENAGGNDLIISWERPS